MGCVNCERLKREIRELREELEEWRLMDGEVADVDANDLAAKIGAYPQTAKLILALARAKGSTLSNDRTVMAIGYQGEQNRNMLAQITCNARRAGFPIERIRGVGLRLPMGVCESVLEMMK